jgi:hypothetical protein
MTSIGSVEDYESLRKLDAGVYDFVMVKRGHSSKPLKPLPIPPDGGIFTWDEISKETDDQGTIIAPDFPRRDGNGRWKRLYSGRINVKWFNAKGDGITDDLPALKAAAEAANQLSADIEIPAGTYILSDTWKLTGRMCKLIGIGKAIIQALNPKELATLEKSIDKDLKTNLITVSSTDKFSIGQKIQIIGLDGGNHVIGTSESYTVESIDEDKNTLKLTPVVKRSYTLSDPRSRNGPFVLSTTYATSVIHFSENVIDATIENIHIEGIGPLRFGIERAGISFQGKRSLRCQNVEISNQSRHGIVIYAGKRIKEDLVDNTLDNRCFYFNNCYMHDNGYAGIYGAPLFTIYEKGKIVETVAGSVLVTGGAYSNNGPEWSGSSAYGITLNGSNTIVAGVTCENNTGPQIDVHSQFKSSLIVQGCNLAWGRTNAVNSPGGMVSISGRCETLIVEGCTMDGSNANYKQFYGISGGGFQIYRTGFGVEEIGTNHESIKITNNVFRNMNVIHASIYLTPWDAKDISIMGNTFINCTRSIVIDNQEQPNKFDPLQPTPREDGSLMGYDKRMIPDIVRIEHNTLIDSGECLVNCGGLVVLADNLFTRKYLASYEIAPFRIDMLVGRVGRVIRRNNKASGLLKGLMYGPSTAALPTNYHWSVGDQEYNEYPIPGSYLGYICTAAGTAGDTITNTKATTSKDSNIIDVADCTVFCPQQWITVSGEKFAKQTAVRILRVIGLAHRLGDRHRDQPAGYQGKLIVEVPADTGVNNADIVFQKAVFQKINLS